MIYRNVRQKSLVLTHRTYTNILGRPATGRVTSRRSCRSRLKDTPIRAIRWRGLRSYEIRVGLRYKVLTYCSYGTHGGCGELMAETESTEHDSWYGQLIIGNYCSPARGSRLCESNLRIGPYHLVDNVLWDQPAMWRKLNARVSNDTITSTDESRVSASPDPLSEVSIRQQTAPDKFQTI